MTSERFALLFPIGFGDLSSESRPRPPVPAIGECSATAVASWPCVLAGWVGSVLGLTAPLEDKPCAGDGSC